MTSSESEGQTASRKRSRKDDGAEDGAGGGGKGKRARGRPRVDTQDATAADVSNCSCYVKMFSVSTVQGLSIDDCVLPRVAAYYHNSCVWVRTMYPSRLPYHLHWDIGTYLQ
jgi:hypothetical protein